MDVLLASWCVIFKLESFNFNIKAGREAKHKYNVWWDDQNTRVINQAVGQFFGIIAGYIISKIAHGRRMRSAFYFLIQQFILEIILHVYILVKHDDWKHIDIYNEEIAEDYETFMLGIVVAGNYLLFFFICKMGMIDIIKFQQLNSNRNFTSIIIFTALGSFCIVQTLFFDRIYTFCQQERFQFLYMIFHKLALILAMCFLRRKLNSET